MFFRDISCSIKSSQDVIRNTEERKQMLEMLSFFDRVRHLMIMIMDIIRRYGFFSKKSHYHHLGGERKTDKVNKDVKRPGSCSLLSLKFRSFTLFLFADHDDDLIGLDLFPRIFVVVCLLCLLIHLLTSFPLFALFLRCLLWREEEKDNDRDISSPLSSLCLHSKHGWSDGTGDT